MAGDPEVVWMPGGVRTEIHLDARDTGGAFCLLVDQPPAGWVLPPHRHRDEAETIHILDGEFEVEIDGARRRLSAGQSVHVPRATLHSSANVGAHAGRRLVIFSPAGMEDFFREAGARDAHDDVDLAGALAAATRHGWEFAAADHK